MNIASVAFLARIKNCVEVVVSLKITDSLVSFAILTWTWPVLYCLLQLNIVLMYILSNSLITRMMTIIQKVIIVIFVKRKGIPNIGFIIVQLVTLQLIPNVFLNNIHLLSLGPSTKKKFIHIISLLSKGLSFIQNVIDVVSTALICPFNVRKLDAAILFIGSVE
ncbi:hypothetical protein ERO13_D10G217801v2 [Gossypium hirsutum]|nr:hypothetical protein ERO13_D10G217801v2 [Gossypium hirsutum]